MENRILENGVSQAEPLSDVEIAELRAMLRQVRMERCKKMLDEALTETRCELQTVTGGPVNIKAK